MRCFKSGGTNGRAEWFGKRFPCIGQNDLGLAKFRPGDYCRRPAMGKTAFVLSMAKNMAVNAKIPVALFSLEMSNVQLVNRMIVNVCEIPGEKIKSGQLAPYEWGQLDYK